MKILVFIFAVQDESWSIENYKPTRNMFNIVLVYPQIPQNTGNIGRLCVSNDAHLHLIRPLGFDINDKYLKRAGLDYWKYLHIDIYDSWNEFINKKKENPFYFFSTKGIKNIWDIRYSRGDYLIFGNETSGLPENFYTKYKDRLYTIPMTGKFKRSLNLSNSAAIVLYEAIRQQTIKNKEV